MRLKCTKLPTQDGFVDTQMILGKWYDVQNVTESMGTGETFYAIKGEDGVLINRAARWFTKPTKGKMKKRPKITTMKSKLEILRNSCMEGLDGTWDCSTIERREGFESMVEVCKELAELLDIKLAPYKKGRK